MTFLARIAQRLSQGCTLQARQEMDPLLVTVVAAALWASFAHDTAEILLAVLLVNAYAFYSRSAKTKRALRNKVTSVEIEGGLETASRKRPAKSSPGKQQGGAESPARAPAFRLPSKAPVFAPTLCGSSWEVQVRELLEQIAPKQVDEEMVKRLVGFVQESVLPLVPEAEITGFVSGNPSHSRAFGVAVPEVEIVITAEPHRLLQRLESRLTDRSYAWVKDNMDRLAKSAIRICTDQLVVAGFKFRRSAFRGQEPKVTLLVPSALGISQEAFAVDLTVNSTTPLHRAALMAECARLEPRAFELVLLVKRWARDRGISHAAKGLLPPYAWSVLVLFFCQVGGDGGVPLLPRIREIGKFLSTGAKSPAQEESSPEDGLAEELGLTVGELFKLFVRFYHELFDWSTELVSLRRGCRGPPELPLLLNIVLGEDGQTSEVGPSIQDPFEVGRNIADCVNAAGLARVREELRRADQLLSGEAPASLTELLEPWAPPERSQEEARGEEVERPSVEAGQQGATDPQEKTRARRRRGAAAARPSP